MQVVSLSKGCVALIDDQDWAEVEKRNWFVSFQGSKKKRAYACTNVKGENGLHKILPMHTLLMNPGPGLVVDHINGNSLDNRRANLRVVTPAQNSMNQWKKGKAGATSIYKGVGWKTRVNAWIAQICSERKVYSYGIWQTQEAAALAYDLASEYHHKEYGQHNNLKERAVEIIQAEIEACSTSPHMKRTCEMRLRRWFGDQVISGEPPRLVRAHEDRGHRK